MRAAFLFLADGRGITFDVALNLFWIHFCDST